MRGLLVLLLVLMMMGCGIQQSKQNSIALSEAVAAGDVAQLETLMAQGGNPHYRNKDHLSAFAMAGKRNDARIIKLFLDRGARPEVDPMAYILTDSKVILQLLDQHWSKDKLEYKPRRAEPVAPASDNQARLAFGVKWAQPFVVNTALKLEADPMGTMSDGTPILDFARQQASLAAEVEINTDDYDKIVRMLEEAQAEDAGGQE